MSLGLAIAGFLFLVTGALDRRRAKKLAAIGLSLLVIAGWTGGYLWPMN